MWRGIQLGSSLSGKPGTSGKSHSTTLHLHLVGQHHHYNCLWALSRKTTVFTRLIFWKSHLHLQSCCNKKDSSHFPFAIMFLDLLTVRRKIFLCVKFCSSANMLSLAILLIHSDVCSNLHELYTIIELISSFWNYKIQVQCMKCCQTLSYLYQFRI
jgi:hypothetical protein